MKLDRILVPLDGSALAETALGTAVDLARQTRATLVLLRAAEAHTFPGADPTDAQILVVREAEDYLAGVASRLGREGDAVETGVWYGPAAPAIVDAARLRKASLIVMSTHGRSGLGRLVMGSVAESVLRGTDVPILLLRAPGAPVQIPAGEAVARQSKETAHV